jgi:hypothetical protein
MVRLREEIAMGETGLVDAGLVNNSVCTTQILLLIK